MTQDSSTERFLSRYSRKPATRQKRRNPNNRIVSPIVTRPLLPKIQSSRENRAVEARRKLLNPAKDGFGPDKSRHRLNDSGARIGLHQPDQRRYGHTRHHAVSIENHHITMTMTPTAAKICDISALSIHR